MNIYHKIGFVHFEDDYIILNLDDQIYKIKLADISPKLSSASEINKNTYKISPSGYGIHWPLIDEDLSIDGLIRFAHSEAMKTNTQPV